MTNKNADQRVAEGRQILEQLGGVALTYAFGCELPGVVDDLPMGELERLWYDQFEAGHREWTVILNGHDHARPIKALNGLEIEGGAGLVVCDDAILCKLTPLGEQWFFDPDTEERFQHEAETSYFRTQLLEAMYERLTANGKELPPLEEIRENN